MSADLGDGMDWSEAAFRADAALGLSALAVVSGGAFLYLVWLKPAGSQ